MATRLLMLLDDIATVLDDVVLLTNVAAKKTAGVLGDDLALYLSQRKSGAAQALQQKLGRGMLLNMLLGVLAGGATLLVVSLVQRLRR